MTYRMMLFILLPPTTRLNTKASICRTSPASLLLLNLVTTSPLPPLSVWTMAPQKPVTEVSRSILPRLTWNGSSAGARITPPKTRAFSARQQQKQKSIQALFPPGHQLHTSALFRASSGLISATSRDTSSSSTIARRFSTPVKPATGRPAVDSAADPIRYNGVYVATFNPARRAFHATPSRQRDHHFDTLKFVQRLKDEGFSEEQAVAMMRVLNDVIQESIQNLTRTMVLREGKRITLPG